ncbi:MAG: hypothetical protein ACE365_06590 [Gammaproteobacteria bacterium]
MPDFDYIDKYLEKLAENCRGDSAINRLIWANAILIPVFSLTFYYPFQTVSDEFPLWWSWYNSGCTELFGYQTEMRYLDRCLTGSIKMGFWGCENFNPEELPTKQLVSGDCYQLCLKGCGEVSDFPLHVGILVAVGLSVLMLLIIDVVSLARLHNRIDAEIKEDNELSISNYPLFSNINNC